VSTLSRCTARAKRLAMRAAGRTESGAVATEYAVLMGFVALALVLGLRTFGMSVDDWYGRLAGAVAALLP
jgi:Flp pilus assembly pilin Flp